MPIEQRSVKKFNGEISRERDSRLWRLCLCGLAVGIVVVVGFAVAAQQHFAAHEFSVKNVLLQRECEHLRNEQKRLLLARETAMSLDQLKRRAEKIGLQEPTVKQINAVIAAAPEKSAESATGTFVSSNAKGKQNSSAGRTKQSQ